MKKEFRKIINVHPVILFKNDIIKLFKIILDCNNNERCEFEAKFDYGEAKESLNNIDEVISFVQDRPTDRLAIQVYIWDNNEIVHGFSINFNFNNISFQIHSQSQTWFLGKIQQLQKFFKTCKPWYASINKLMPILSPLLIIPGINVAIYAFKNNLPYLFASTLIFSIFWAIITVLTFKQTIFPYVRIYTTDNKPNKLFTKESISLVVGIISLLVSIFSEIVLPLIIKKP